MAFVKTHIGKTRPKVESALRPLFPSMRADSYDVGQIARKNTLDRSRCLTPLAWRVAPKVIHLVALAAWRLRIDDGGGFPDPPFVIAANHHSFLDPPVIGAVYKRRLRFLTLIDLFGNYRWLDLTLRTFEVIEMRRAAVPLGALRQALEHLANGGVVALFPEGTRTWRFGDKPFAPGASWLAVRAKVPVVPIAISGTGRVLGADNKLHRGRIEAFVGPALYADGTARPAVDDLTRRWAGWIESRLRA